MKWISISLFWRFSTFANLNEHFHPHNLYAYVLLICIVHHQPFFTSYKHDVGLPCLFQSIGSLWHIFIFCIHVYIWHHRMCKVGSYNNIEKLLLSQFMKQIYRANVHTATLNCCFFRNSNVYKCDCYTKCLYFKKSIFFFLKYLVR